VHRIEVIADGPRVRHGIDQREMISQLGQLGVHFVELHARYFGRNRLVGSAVIDRCFRLHVPGIEVAWRADQEQRDNVADLCIAGALAGFL